MVSFIAWVWPHVLHGARSALLTMLPSMPSTEPGTQLVPKECLFTESPRLNMEPGTQLVSNECLWKRHREREPRTEGEERRREGPERDKRQTRQRWMTPRASAGDPHLARTVASKQVAPQAQGPAHCQLLGPRFPPAAGEEMRAHVSQVFDGRAMDLLESGHFAGSAWELVARAAAPGLCGFSGLCSYPHVRRQPVPPLVCALIPT